MKWKPLPTYQTKLVPALEEIQRKYGYLDQQQLKDFSREAGIPLYRIQEVASFFSQFRLTKEDCVSVTVRICRDQTCHMAGGAELIQKLTAICPEVRVEGVSCIGRCDRAPAAYVNLGPDNKRSADGASGKEREHSRDLLFLGKTAEELKKIVLSFKDSKGPAPSHDLDKDQPYRSSMWKIDPYPDGADCDYLAAKKAIALRNEALESAVKILRSQLHFPDAAADLFRLTAVQRLDAEAGVDEKISDAVRAWQTEDGWAKGRELGGWSDVVLQEMDKGKEKKGADLRGMGGAGVPASQKWRDVRDAVREARVRRQDDRAFIVVNGDESEPGTFKDRELLLRAPHLVVEGVILAGLVTEASQGFIYIRHEYGEQIQACRKAIRRAEELGLCGMDAWALGRAFPVSVFVSPGGYICGEQSALIEAMSDRRAEPRNMPPALATNGLDDRPTLVSNVETFAWTPYIWLNGGESYASLGTNECRGRRFFSVSGDVKRPGVFEVPMGMTLGELIHGEQYCQGIRGDRKLKALAPSGPSGGFLPASLPIKKAKWKESDFKSWERFAQRHGIDPATNELDLMQMELELNVFRAYSPTGMLGAGLVVYSDERDMAEQAVNSNEFFRNETCGKCVPCRIGSQKFAAFGANLLDKGIDQLAWERELSPLLAELGRVMELTSICGLGKSVAQPLRTVAEFFKEDLAQHLVVQSNPRGHRHQAEDESLIT